MYLIPEGSFCKFCGCLILSVLFGSHFTNSGNGPRTSLGSVTLTVGVVLGPVWGLSH